MRRFFSVFLLIITLFSVMINAAEAKRFGGGRSFGMQRSIGSASSARPFSSLSSLNQSASSKRWLAPLAGLAAGGLLAYLFMGHGIGSGILSWLIIGGVVLLLINLLRNKTQAISQPAAFSAYQHAPHQEALSRFMNRHETAQPVNSLHYPAGFQADAFLREAKVIFIRLQAAYDKKDLNDLREFTSPDVFAEIQLQLHERGEAINQTEVMKLDAELLEAADAMQTITASVRFTALIREEIGTAPQAVVEIWHFRKDSIDSSWTLIGIQQT